MIRGFESLKNGMMSIMDYHDNIAHNLANINTTAYKQTNLTFKNIHDAAIHASNRVDFSDETNSSQIGVLSLGSQTDKMVIDFSQGVLRDTGRNFDFAIEGDGFFKIQEDDGNFVYTRNGAFLLQEDKTITTYDNKPVMCERGIVRLNTNEPLRTMDIKAIDVRTNGDIYYQDRLLGRIDVYDFPNKEEVKQVGKTSFVSRNEETNKPEVLTRRVIQQGFLENSNGNTIKTMIDSITAQRSYESMNNIMQTNSKTLEKAIGQVGRVIS